MANSHHDCFVVALTDNTTGDAPSPIFSQPNKPDPLAVLFNRQFAGDSFNYLHVAAVSQPNHRAHLEHSSPQQVITIDTQNPATASNE